MKTRHLTPGPDEHFRKRFAFTDEEKKKALENGRLFSDKLTPEDVERAGALVHELIYPASEDHPLSIVDIFERFESPGVESIVASNLLAMAYPRWQRERKAGEKSTGGTQTFVSGDAKSQFGTTIQTDDCYLWLKREDD
ncbi:MAG: hypothetical protein ABH834_00065 [Candidatus Altiarchaeota archaeon]